MIGRRVMVIGMALVAAVAACLAQPVPAARAAELNHLGAVHVLVLDAGPAHVLAKQLAVRLQAEAVAPTPEAVQPAVFPFRLPERNAERVPRVTRPVEAWTSATRYVPATRGSPDEQPDRPRYLSFRGRVC